jgi:hypothetical protein
MTMEREETTPRLAHSLDELITSARRARLIKGATFVADEVRLVMFGMDLPFRPERARRFLENLLSDDIRRNSA